jgi:multimeric flavodoxin WrbA
MLKAADAYVFASPVYFNTVTTLFKNFIDRTNCLCGYYEENQKKLGVFLVGQADEESLNSALSYIKEYADIMNFDVEENNVCVIAREADEFEMSDEIIDTVGKWF